MFPKRECKGEYLERYRKRGSSESFIGKVDKEWEVFVDNMWFPGKCVHVELGAGEYLADIFGGILEGGKKMGLADEV